MRTKLFSLIAEELAAVEARLASELRSPFPYVDQMVRYGCMLGGKRLRPALLLLSARANSSRCSNEHIVLAAVIEMIHTATLIHDDVLDGARLRRNLATVHERWDTEASVLLGDFLFTHAFYLASTLDSVIPCRLIGRATNIVCEGELRQKGSRGNFELSEADYLGIVEAKTAELTAVSCRLGGVVAGADEETAQSMDNFGRNLGIAFQIADDLLDLVGDEATAGKSLGSDLEKRKLTLPLIHAIEHTSASDRAALRELFADGCSPAALLPLLRQCGSLEYAHHKALEFSDRARRQLNCLPPTAARESLSQLCDFVVFRSH